MFKFKDKLKTCRPPQRVYRWESRVHNGIVRNLFEREIHGKQLQRGNPFGSSGYPTRLRMSVEQVIPQSALEAGNVFMGFTDCGRYLLSYTVRPTENFGLGWGDRGFMYHLHFWLFTPYKPAQKVSSVALFDNTGVVDSNLLIEISQWKKDDSRILVTGQCSVEDRDPHHTQYFATVTTIPPTQPCPDCRYVPDEELEEDSVHLILHPCLKHGLTVNLTFDYVLPFPKFDADIQLRYKNGVAFNTGNVLHVFTFKVLEPVNSSRSELPPMYNTAPSVSSFPYLYCDLWLKCPHSIGKILRKGPVREDTKFYSADQDSYTQHFSRSHRETNLLSIEGQESFMGSLPLLIKLTNMAVSYENMVLNNIMNRRWSQTSLDSETSSQCNTTDCKQSPSRESSTDSDSEKSSDASSSSFETNETTPTKSSESPSKGKLMLPPQERKFFKRRVSSPCYTSSTSPIKTEPVSSGLFTKQPCGEPEEKKIVEPTKSSSSTAYNIYDIGTEEVLQERSFSSFRKRRLADKKYEFSEADLSSENIIPLKLNRKDNVPKPTSLNNFNQLGSPRSPRSPRYEIPGSESPRYYLEGLSYPRSPRGPSYVASPVMSPNSEQDVLRPISNMLNSNFNLLKASVMSPKLGDDENLTDAEKFQESCTQFRDNCNPRSRGSTPKRSLGCPVAGVSREDKPKLTNDGSTDDKNAFPTFSASINCTARILRSYIHRDDDDVSVITDIEDDYNLGQPFFAAVPLDVRGNGYQQLHMISNSKAEKSQVPVAQVLQRTLDIELLCNEVASIICRSEEKKYCSCIDYDTAIIDVCPERGTITAAVFVMISAKNKRGKGSNEKQADPVDPFDCYQKRHEATFSFAWDPSQEYCRILYMGRLKELPILHENWHPTKHIVNIVKSYGRKIGLQDCPKVLANNLAVSDCLSVDELVDSRGMISVYLDDNLSRLTSDQSETRRTVE